MKNGIIVRIIAGVIISSSTLILTAPPARADYWGMAIAATILNQSLTKIQKQIEGIMLAVLKTTAISVIQSNVNSMIGGSNASDTKIITDWQKYLYDDPTTTTKTYMTSYLTSATGGRSTGNYSSDWSTYLQSSAKSNLITGSDATMLTSNMDEIVSNPKSSLDSGNLLAYDAYWSNPMNNPYGFTMIAQNQEQYKLSQEQQKQYVKSISHGYDSVEKNGKVILPGSTVGQIVADSQNIGNNVIASSQSPYELASGVVLSIVNKAVTKMIQSGVGSIQANLQREVNSVTNSISSQVGTISRTSGTLSKYTTEVRQQSGTTANTAANAATAIPVK
ncbi:MAG: hypothetical protein HGA31_01235 [Candidatus Moranbacteria bacterium]|nr:hypothetical protein [Candidatus Moranbacteria bacterium]